MSALLVNEFNSVINHTIMISFPIAICFQLLLPYVLGKYFDQWFGDVNPPLTIVFSSFKGFGRAQYYAMCIVHKNRSSSKRLYPYYSGFNFRAHARKIDIVISYIFYCSAVLTIFSLLIWNVLSYF